MPRNGGSKEECHGIVPVPPLHQGILNSGVKRVTFQETNRYSQRIENMQNSYGGPRLQCKTRWKHKCGWSAAAKIVPNMLMPKITQITAMAMSIGHSSSAYSLPVVKPASNVTAAATIIDCHPQKWILLSFSL